MMSRLSHPFQSNQPSLSSQQQPSQYYPSQPTKPVSVLRQSSRYGGDHHRPNTTGSSSGSMIQPVVEERRSLHHPSSSVVLQQQQQQQPPHHVGRLDDNAHHHYNNNHNHHQHSLDVYENRHTFPTMDWNHHHHHQNGRRTNDVRPIMEDPKIELSARQKEILSQRQHPLPPQQQAQQPHSNITTDVTTVTPPSTGAVVVVAAAAAALYSNEPWDQPFVVQQQQLPPSQRQQKTLLQSVLHHPAQRRQRTSPKPSPPQLQISSHHHRGNAIDPPAMMMNVTTTLGSSSSRVSTKEPETRSNQNNIPNRTIAEPMEAQRELVRHLLVQKHKPTTMKKPLSATGSSIAGSSSSSSAIAVSTTGRSSSSRNNDIPNNNRYRLMNTHSKTMLKQQHVAVAASLSSPKSRFQRVMETAAQKIIPHRTSPKPYQQQHLPSQSTSVSIVATPTLPIVDTNAVTVIPEPYHTPTTNNHHTVPTSSRLQDQMRQRFQKKNQIAVKIQPTVVVPETRPVIETVSVNTTGSTTDGYDTFVQSLKDEVLKSHSQLYASFVVAFDSTQTRDDILLHQQQSRLVSSNNQQSKQQRSVTDVDMIQQIHYHLQETYSNHNNNNGNLFREKTQLVRDKVYNHQSSKERKKESRQLSLPVDVSTTNTTATATVTTTGSTTTTPPLVSLPLQYPVMVAKPVVSKHTSTKYDYDADVVLNSRSMDSNSVKKSSSRVQLSVEIPISHSSSESTSGTNDTSPTTSSTTIAETNSTSGSLSLHGRPAVVVGNVQPNDVGTVHHETIVSSSSSEWNRIQLRTVHSHDSYDVSGKRKKHSTNNIPAAPEWANIALRPVSSRSDTASSSSTATDPQLQFHPAYDNTTAEVFEKLTMDEIMETENVTMIRLKEEIINCCCTGSSADENHGMEIESRVVIGETVIRHIQYDAVDMTALVTVVWTIPRNEIEPDGLTINMSTFKVTLSLLSSALKQHRLARRKVLSFETSEDCLRFATAFYRMPIMSPQKQQHSQPTIVHQIIDPVTDQKQFPAEQTLAQERPILVVDHGGSTDADIHMTEQPLNQEEQVVLEKYREFRLTKEANDALMETMALQQTKYNAAAVAAMATSDSGALPSNVDAVIGSLPNSPISTFTATTVGGHGDGKITISSSSSSSDPQWTDDERKVVDKYRLMIQRGVPLDAVRHKMTLDQVDTKIVSFIVSNNDGSSSTTVSSSGGGDERKNESSLSFDDNVIAEKYRKMLKLRIPVDAVRHKMVQDQVESKIMAVVLGIEHEPDVNEPKKTNKAVNCSTKTAKTTLSEEEESVAVQYRKLLKINVSKDALLSRMQREGVSPNIIMAILGQNAALFMDDGDKAANSSGSTGSKMISINWDHTERAIAGSVWEAWQNAEPEPMDFSQLKQMFQRKERLQKDMKNMDPTNGIGKAKLLDITRSNNIAISLKAFKEFTHSELAELIRFLDPIRKIRGERTNFIRDLLPTVTEAKIVDDYTGSDERLVPAELWFRHLTGIERIERKARVIRTMEMFVADSVEVRDNFRLLAEVCRQVVSSPKLRDVLGLALRIGNTMNEGTRNGRAAGFKFNSLLRFTQTKSADGNITVLDYLVSVFVEKGESDTLDLVSDFPNCHKASRYLISDMSNEVKSLKESLEQCKLELADLEREENPPPLTSTQQQQTDGNGTATNPHSLLLASILSRADGGATSNDSKPKPRKSAESFAKRDEFLAAINTNKRDISPVVDHIGTDDETQTRELASTAYENSLSGGITRLRQFIKVVEESFARLEKTRIDALAACKDLSIYCGESGGVGVTISLLDILSQFTKSVEDALKKYHDQQANDARKLKLQESKETQSVKSSESVGSVRKKDRTSIVFVLSDILKNAKPGFIEDFKKGRCVPNPSESLKEVYERERNGTKCGTLRLDIVSAIQQRGEKADDKEEIEKARSTFAGVQALPDDSSPRELAIEQISSFPFSSSDSQSECAISIDGASTSSNANIRRQTSVDPIVNTTPKKEVDDGSTNKIDDLSFDIRSSQDRLRSRRSLSPSNMNSGSLADVMKSLEEIKKQSPLYPSPIKKMQPLQQRQPNEMPPLSQPRSVERKSISERARDKRSEKRPIHHPVNTTETTTTSVSVVSLVVPSQPTLTIIDQPQQQRRLTSVNEVGITTMDVDDNNNMHPNNESPQKTDSSFARLARQKRLQKRMSK